MLTHANLKYQACPPRVRSRHVPWQGASQGGICVLLHSFRAASAVALTLVCFASGHGASLRVDLEWDAREAGRAGIAGASPKPAELKLSIPGFGNFVREGTPALPCRIIYVALPPDADENTLRVDESALTSEILPGSYIIPPVPCAAPADSEKAEPPAREDGFASDIYSTDEFYPTSHVIVNSVGRLRTWKVAAIEFRPYRYNPVTGKVATVSSGEARINFDLTPRAPARYSDPIAEQMSGFLANRDQALSWYGYGSDDFKSVPRRSPAYAIITTSRIASACPSLAGFASLQELRGFRVIVATESEWGGGSGDTAAENIRAWLRSNFVEMDINYVLLVGDPTPQTGDVPMKLLWPRWGQPSYQEAPSDYYYADLTGNWDRDGDGRPGEEWDDFGPGGIDRVPDVYLGRIACYTDVAQTDRILRKIIAAESTSPGDWGRRLLLPMKPLDTVTPSYHLGERIANDIARPLGFEPVRVYETDYGLSPPPERYPCYVETVVDEWLRGAGVVLWMTHGGAQTANGVLTSSACELLDDTRPAVVYSASCSNGRPEDPSNLACSLLANGATSALAASRVSWYYIGESDFTCSDSIGGLGYQYLNNVLGRRNSIGQASFDARLAVPMNIWPNHLVYNLYGDPSFVLNQPSPGAVAGSVRTVTGSPVPGATVRCRDSGRSAVTDADGSYTLGGLWEGPKTIGVDASGFYSQSSVEIPVVSGQITQLNFSLVEAACGSIRGCVRDLYGASVPDAVVAIHGGTRTVQTNPDGSFFLDSLPPGEYRLIASRFPHVNATTMACDVIEGRITPLEIVLRSRIGNTVINGGFEDGFTDAVANGWRRYATTGYTATPSIGSDFAKRGRYSQKLRLPPAEVDARAGLLQSVSVVPGTPYTLIAWRRGEVPDASESDPEAVTCRLGYDPCGGTDPCSPSIIWSRFSTNGGAWYCLFDNVIAYSRRLTVFLDAARAPAPRLESAAVWFDSISLIGPVETPSAPEVRANARFQNDTREIGASWSCPDSDVTGFEMGLSATRDELGMIIGGGWEQVGMVNCSRRTGLSLANGDLVRTLIRSIGSRGVAGEIGFSEPTRIVADVTDHAKLKTLPDGLWVGVRDLIVSRNGQGPECYLQNAERTIGIKAEGRWSTIWPVAPGTRATVVGRLRTVDGFRVLIEAEMMPSVQVAAPASLAMANRWVGSDPNAGLGAAGLLVRVWGRVTGVGVDSFVIDDGSLPEGLPILCHNNAAPPREGSFVTVTGIAARWGLGVYSAADISIRD